MIKTSITGIEQAPWATPLVLRGTHEQIIQQASFLGYDGVELHIRDPFQVDYPALRSYLKHNQIALTSIGTGPSYSQDYIFLTHNDSDIREIALQRMKRFISMAEDSHAVVIIGLIKGQIKDCHNQLMYMSRFKDSLHTCLTYAEKHHVVLAVEIIDRYECDCLNTIDEGLALIHEMESNSLKLHIDTFHMNIEETDCAAAIRRAGNHIGHVHVADSDRWYQGHGHYDFKPTYQALIDTHYDKAIALESFPYPDSETAAREALYRMKACLG